MTTVSFRSDTIERQWHLVDFEGLILGRAASRIASVLRGKHRPTYTPNADCGDFVVVINAEKLKLTGNKLEGKIYYRHSGYLGGLKSLTAGELLEKNPARVIELAVQRMMPSGPLGRRMIKKLKVYAGTDHPHEAQNPTPLDLNTI
jgi:large subunit ribosomal protein L13